MTAIETDELPEDAGWGPTSRQVARNLKRLRKARGMSTTRLSAALRDDAGHAIPATGITRIEKGQRRVDTDDLVAFALVFNVSPLTLLLPATASEAPAPLTDKRTVTSSTAWYWGVGRRPAVDWEPGAIADLAGPGVDPAIASEAYEREEEYVRQQAAYTALALPPELRRVTDNHAVRIARQLLELVEDLATPEPGVDREGQAARARTARRRYESLGIELDELQERFDRRQALHPGLGFEQFRDRLAVEGSAGEQTSEDEPGGK
ncbi:helix-turn-helix transcriptional regulator [Streptomyces sp. NPDC091215]|uniref:helix-turn-helix domain-containing protein n=1 Tax=Streptomyces sp. NPDC091215 TaxID=3155192 RepID=UPI003439A3BC